MEKLIIIGATSGIGRAVAEHYAQRGVTVGITGRRTALLEEIQGLYPSFIHIKTMDITDADAAAKLQELIAGMGGMDTLFINSGYGKELPELDAEVELQAVRVNALGFTAMAVAGYNYFKSEKRPGHIVVTSSVASVRALRQAPAYSASKRYMRQYTEALAQRARHERLPLKFTTLMPGFIATDFLTGYNYPLIVSLPKVVKGICRAIDRRRRAVYLPFRWNFVVFFWRLIPRWIWERC